ncbi:MAG: hypothetical protein ACK4VN_12385 [Bacteroidales bacterium]
MKNLRFFSILFVALVGLTFTACKQGQRQEATDLLSDSLVANEIRLDDRMVGEMISSIPNPVEMSSLLQRSGVVYSQELLNPVGNINNYNTNFKRALNLGVYGTDLVYMNIYDRTISTLRYLSNVRDLAADLRVEQFFDYETLNRLSESSRNIDSVLFITNSGFDRMSRYLIEQGRSNISVLISYGTWIQSMYIATHVQTMPPNRETINMRIGEQKKVLDNILLLLHTFRRDPNFEDLIQDLMELKREFDKVTISYVYAEPTMKEIDGMIVLVDNSRSEVNIPDDAIEGITRVVARIRNKIIN